MKNRILLLSLFIACLTLSYRLAYGQYQEDVTRGPQIGLHAGMTSWDLDDITEADLSFETESGFHFGGSVGWGMSDWLGVFTRYDYTTISPEDIESYAVSHWDIGIRAIPYPLGLTVRPYFEAVGSFRFLEFTDPNGFQISASGPGFGFGAGLYVFVTTAFALNAGIAASFGNLEEITFAGIPLNDVGATSGRLLFGITWFP